MRRCPIQRNGPRSDDPGFAPFMADAKSRGAIMRSAHTTCQWSTDLLYFDHDARAVRFGSPPSYGERRRFIDVGYTGEKKREYAREWMRARRSYLIRIAGGRCVDCGTDQDLDFDHRIRHPGNVKISSLTSRTWNRLREELNKCELRCKQCHRSKHVRLGEAFAIVHGANRYSLGCRCDTCRQGKSARMRDYRARRCQSTVA